VLVRLDPRDFDQAVTEAQAAVAKADASLTLDQAQLDGVQAQVAVARSQAKLAQDDRDRYATLQGQGSTTQRQYEQALTTAQVAEAQLTAAEKAVKAAAAKLEVDRKALDSERARYDDAVLKRSYATITAPAAGMIASKSVEAGQVLSPGQPLCQVVPLTDGDLWVDANFKETQLHRIRPGQPATITVDAISGHEFHGEVVALSAGTGAAFSLLPPENASGNWVKIVQRLPVRIRLDGGDAVTDRLRLGLSAHVIVDTNERGR
jgi:membrane fusion protein (multidrug efflux system)